MDCFFLQMTKVETFIGPLVAQFFDHPRGSNSATVGHLESPVVIVPACPTAAIRNPGGILAIPKIPVPSAVVSPYKMMSNHKMVDNVDRVEIIWDHLGVPHFKKLPNLWKKSSPEPLSTDRTVELSVSSILK